MEHLTHSHRFRGSLQAMDVVEVVPNVEVVSEAHG